MIKQIINTSQIVQTGLAVEVDGIRVDYRRIHDEFAYKFTLLLPIYETIDSNLIEATIDQVVSALCGQSYDHGAEWRETCFMETSFDPWTGEYTLSLIHI